MLSFFTKCYKNQTKENNRFILGFFLSFVQLNSIQISVFFFSSFHYTHTWIHRRVPETRSGVLIYFFLLFFFFFAIPKWGCVDSYDSLFLNKKKIFVCLMGFYFEIVKSKEFSFFFLKQTAIFFGCLNYSYRYFTLYNPWFIQLFDVIWMCRFYLNEMFNCSTANLFLF